MLLPLSHHCADAGELLIPDFLQFPIPPLQQLLARFWHCINSPLQKQSLSPAVAETPAAVHSFAASPRKVSARICHPFGGAQLTHRHTSCECILQVCAVCTRHSGFKNHWRSKIDFRKGYERMLSGLHAQPDLSFQSALCALESSMKPTWRRCASKS